MKPSVFKFVYFGSFGLSSKEPYTVILCPLCVSSHILMYRFFTCIHKRNSATETYFLKFIGNFWLIWLSTKKPIQSCVVRRCWSRHHCRCLCTVLLAVRHRNFIFCVNTAADPEFPVMGAQTSDVGAFWRKCVQK